MSNTDWRDVARSCTNMACRDLHPVLIRKVTGHGDMRRPRCTKQTLPGVTHIAPGCGNKN